MIAVAIIFSGCNRPETTRKMSDSITEPVFKLIPADTFYFKSMVDCNMAEAWIGDTFRIFPGKYGEDPLWGYSNDLKYADGKSADEAFLTPSEAFKTPLLPPNAKPGQQGLHGAVWFETVYQEPADASGKTLYAVYHNENYPSTLPYDSITGKGYKNKNWPQGLLGPQSPAAVCRICIMKSVNGGHSWEDKGIFIEDHQPRFILKPTTNRIPFQAEWVILRQLPVVNTCIFFMESTAIQALTTMTPIVPTRNGVDNASVLQEYCLRILNILKVKPGDGMEKVLMFPMTASVRLLPPCKFQERKAEDRLVLPKEAITGVHPLAGIPGSIAG